MNAPVRYDSSSIQTCGNANRAIRGAASRPTSPTAPSACECLVVEGDIEGRGRALRALGPGRLRDGNASVRDAEPELHLPRLVEQVRRAGGLQVRLRKRIRPVAREILVVPAAASAARV